MKLMFRATRRILGGAALLCATTAQPATALAGPALAGPALAGPAQASAAQASAAAPAAASAAPAIPRCHAGQTLIWLGLGLGGGTAGTIFYPLEFTNISKHTCTLSGYPSVAALRKSGRQIGKWSRRLSAHHGLVTLRPGWTAHAALGIVEAGNVCSKPVTASWLKVHAPHQARATQLPFQFQACAHKGVLVTGPVQAGVGIP
jgi:Protein of unknown function (DUF4232)